MGYKLIVSQKALQMLEQNIAFIAGISKQTARNRKERIVSALKKIEEDPQIYPFFAGEYVPPNKYHKLVVDKRYLVIYQIKDKTVYVDYIVDTRQDYQWLIR